MCMSLGGRVAESLVFNKISSGAQNDLEKVTKMAYAMIQTYGMDPIVGPLSFPTSDELKADMGLVGKKPFSKQLGNTIDLRARLLVANAYKQTESLLKDNSDKLKLLSETLLHREVLNYSDIESLIGPPPHGKKKLIESLELGSTTEPEPQNTSNNKESLESNDSNNK